jgi:hypothetical protein
MKKIRLKRVYYLNWKGVVLSADNPSIEATEENLFKLKEFIKGGQLEVIDNEVDIKKQKENPPHIDPPMINLPELKNDKILTDIERIEVYSEEQLKGMTKNELVEVAKTNKIEFKKNISTVKLITLILERQ